MLTRTQAFISSYSVRLFGRFDFRAPELSGERKLFKRSHTIALHSKYPRNNARFLLNSGIEDACGFISFFTP